MAFIDFNAAALRTLPVPTFNVSAHGRISETASETADELSALEQRIIELARADGLETLRPPQKRSWLARLILGPPAPAAMLANEKLEALRRLAVQAWRKGHALPGSALKEARDAGYSEAQVGAVIDAVNRARTPFRRLAA
ncbi:hypothetical protein SAMN05518801_101279 [Novosphingobium sp. CF614]|uniref:hypothetical protein n=1 Tax=Novosphingobium sp. CF614 TaxID=1884364 RepID=UPI0008E1302B|nr:hypothetical protein [Novosphingobium sp. CF614]SFF75704.1 hypothetical protein SAMN05518801_101279 [Novosphingobium sp. CF614]